MKKHHNLLTAFFVSTPSKSISLHFIITYVNHLNAFKKTSSIKIKELYKISPFGSFSTFCSGFIFSAMFTMLSVYAVTMNLSVFDISILLFAVTLSGAIFQWPIGSLSDKYDRRIVIIGCCIASSIFAVLSIAASGISFENLLVGEMFKFNYFSPDTAMDETKIFIFIVLLSGMTLPLFALNLALVDDYIPQEQFVAAGAGLNIIASSKGAWLNTRTGKCSLQVQPGI